MPIPIDRGDFPETRADFQDADGNARSPGEADDAGNDLTDLLASFGYHENRFTADVGTAVDTAVGALEIVAADVTFTPAGTVGATDVQAAIEEVANDSASVTLVTDHTGDTAGAHAASAISVTPAGTIAATEVQAALVELDTEKSATTHNHTFDGLSNVDMTGKIVNSVPKWNGSAWVVGVDNDSGSGTGATQLDELTDVDLTGQANGDALTRVAGVWVPVPTATQAELDAHTADAADAHAASAITYTPSGTISATTVAGAIAEAATDAAQKSNNLSDLTSASTGRTNLGLGSISTQAASAVAITGGTMAGVTITGGSVSGLASDLAIADGGTGASTAAAALTALGAASTTNLTAHTGASSAAHAASAVSFNPAGLAHTTATNVQSAMSAYDAAITAAAGGTGSITDYTGVYNVKNPTYSAIGNGVADDTLEIQAAIDACSTAGGGIVYLPVGTYLVSQAVRANGLYCALMMKSNVSLVGAGRQCTTIKLANSQTVVTGSSAVITNRNPNATSSFDENMHFAHFSINGNSPNQPSTAIYNGIGLARCQHVTFSYVDVYDHAGSNTSSNEAFGFEVRRGAHIRHLFCRAWGSAGATNCPTGFSCNYMSDVSYLSCDSWGHTTSAGGGIGFTMYDTTQASYTNCRSWSNETLGYNQELSECEYVNCIAGLTTSDLVNGSGGIYSPLQDLGNGHGFWTNTSVESGGHASPQTHSRYVNCVASNNSVRGFGTRLGVTATATTGTTSSTVVTTATSFYPGDVGSFVKVGTGVWVEVATYVSGTQVTTTSAHGGTSGNVVLVARGTVDIINCQADRNQEGVSAGGSGVGRICDGTFTRVSGTRFIKNTTNMAGYSDTQGEHTPFGYLRTDSGGDTVQPAVPATGVLYYNHFAHDCNVYIFASAITWTTNGIQKRGSGVATSTSTLTTDTIVPGASCTGVITVKVAAGEAIGLNYTAKNGTDTLNWRWESAMLG